LVNILSFRVVMDGAVGHGIGTGPRQAFHASGTNSSCVGAGPKTTPRQSFLGTPWG
jgi:hypothetical protein